MFAKSLQWRDGDDLAIDVDDEHAEGGWSTPEVIPAAFPPSGVFIINIYSKIISISPL